MLDDDREPELPGDEPEASSPDADAVEAGEGLPSFPSDDPEASASDAETVEALPSAPGEPERLSLASSPRSLAIGFALVALVAVIGFDVWYMLRTARRQVAPTLPGTTATRDQATGSTPAGVAAAASTATTDFESEPAEPAATEEPAAVASAGIASTATEAFEDEGEEGPPSVEPQKPKPEQRVLRGTVRDAAARSCSTSAVDGLSRQIIAQSRCIDPKAFVAVPRRPNLSVASNVFLYMDASARDRFVKALDANPKKTMKVHSALRTVAQQYLLRRWALGKRCGIELATPPGESNHESGLGLDISEPGAWRSALEAQGFRWLGTIDRVHFDYKGPGASSRANVDVKAFQQLWNRNHKDDPLPENGRYTPATEARLEKAPAAGFPLGPRCDR